MNWLSAELIYQYRRDAARQLLAAGEMLRQGRIDYTEYEAYRRDYEHWDARCRLLEADPAAVPLEPQP